MTTIPPDILAPEPTAALAIGTLQQQRATRRAMHAHPRRRRRSRRLRGIQLLRDIRNRPLKRDPALRRVQRDNVRFRPHHVDHQRAFLLR